jgi:splicing factor 3A subunit 3
MPCKKIFTNEQTLFHHKKGKKHIKMVNKLSIGAASIPASEFDNVKDQFVDQEKEMKLKMIARLEFKIIQLKGILADTIYNSANEARKKQSQTYQEIEAENQDIGVDEISSGDEDEDGMNSKTRKLPLGSDGRPIPYWLYKLHGLGVEYKCEICGGASYWGRRAFDKHFQEWRHAYGMKCLKIPNTSHFKDVTEIAEALKLHRKIIEDNYNNSFKPDLEEEFEDENGNIFSRKKYIELKRKGAIK